MSCYIYNGEKYTQEDLVYLLKNKGSWKYEIYPNLNINGETGQEILDELYKRQNEKGYLLTLDEIVGDELKKAYPALSNVKVELSGQEQNVLAFYENAGLRGKRLNIAGVYSQYDQNKFGSPKSIIHHEIQHAIQDIEGFSTGGNPELFNELKNIEDKQKVASLLNKSKDRNKWGMLSMQLNVFDRSRVTYLINAIGFDKVKKFTSALRTWNEEKTGYQQYLNIVGEVEARNVQSRIDMTPQQRRETLLQQTEDVAREDQIFLRDNLGISMSLNSPQRAEKEVIDRLKQSGLAENVFEMNTQEIDAKLAELGVDAETRKQVMAYHGSPHSFDRFTTEKMGTGEGVQAFSWGLYFTDLESIAKNYANNLANLEIIGAPKKVNEALNYVFTVVNNPFRGKSDYISKEELESFLSQASKYAEGEQYGRGADEELFKIVDIAWSYVQDNYDDIEVKANRNLYKVSLHKGKTPDQYTWLEWDKPLNETQIDKILSNEELFKVLRENSASGSWTKDEVKSELLNSNTTGENLYKFLNRNLTYPDGNNTVIQSTQKDVSLELLKSGIDGVKYPAESISRGATSDTARGFNYVVFDENAITIEEQIQFSKALNNLGINLTVNGFTYKSDVYLNTDQATNETAIHEFNHLYSSWLKQNRPEVYQLGLDLVQQELGLRGVNYQMQYPNRNKIIFVSTDKLLERLGKDDPNYDIQNEKNRIGNRLEKAKDFLQKYVTDNRYINPKTGERTNTNVSFETSVVGIYDGKLGFTDGRHRVLAAKELGYKEVAIEIPTDQEQLFNDLLAKPSEIQDIINYVKKTQPDLKGEALQEEILTQLVGERGAKLLEDLKGKKSGILDWLRDVWNEIANMLGLRNMSAEQVANLTLGEYADAMAVDLLSGQDLRTEPTIKDVITYATATQEELTVEQKQSAIESGVANNYELFTQLQQAFLDENNVVVFNKSKLKKAGYNEYEIASILSNKDLQNSIRDNIFKVGNSEFNVDYNGEELKYSDELTIFGKQKVYIEVKEEGVNEIIGGEIKPKKSDTLQTLRKTYPINPEPVSQKLDMLFTSVYAVTENVAQRNNTELKDVAKGIETEVVKYGVDLRGIENKVLPLNQFKSFIGSLEAYIKNPNDNFSEIYDNFFNISAEEPQDLGNDIKLDTELSEYELFRDYNLIRKEGNTYTKIVPENIEDLYNYFLKQQTARKNGNTGFRDRRRWDSSRGNQTLAGAPIIKTIEGVTGADPELTYWAEEYARRNGIDYRRQSEYVEVDENRAKRIAEEYEKMKHDPQDSKVKEAYANLIKQTIAQYEILKEAGYEFYFFDETNDPYNGSPWQAMRELRVEKRMGVFATEAGFGSGATELNVNDNPLLADTGFEWGFGSIDGQKKRVLANDLFRAVHDAFGHGLEGSGFRARGEENAWQSHIRLFTGSAKGAITSETRGQNSWLNYGKFGEQNRTAKVEDTIFADQKTGLMPEWTWTEGVEEVKESLQTKEQIQAKVSEMQVEDEVTDSDVLEAMYMWKNFLNVPIKTKSNKKPSFVNLVEAVNNPFLKATSKGIQLISNDPITKAKADLYREEVTQEESFKIEDDLRSKIFKGEITAPKITTDYTILEDGVLLTKNNTNQFLSTNQGNYEMIYQEGNISFYKEVESEEKTFSDINLNRYLNESTFPDKYTEINKDNLNEVKSKHFNCQ